MKLLIYYELREKQIYDSTPVNIFPFIVISQDK